MKFSQNSQEGLTFRSYLDEALNSALETGDRVQYDIQRYLDHLDGPLDFCFKIDRKLCVGSYLNINLVCSDKERQIYINESFYYDVLHKKVCFTAWWTQEKPIRFEWGLNIEDYVEYEKLYRDLKQLILSEYVLNERERNIYWQENDLEAAFLFFKDNPGAKLDLIESYADSTNFVTLYIYSDNNVPVEITYDFMSGYIQFNPKNYKGPKVTGK